MDYVFLSVSRTHLDPFAPSCAPIEIAGMRTDESGRNVIAAANERIELPLDSTGADALDFYGYEALAWANAMQPKRAFDTVRDKLFADDASDQFCLVSHDVEGDRVMLARNATFHAAMAGRAWISTNTLAWPFNVTKQIGNRRLSTLVKYFGNPANVENEAARTVVLTRFVYFEMLRRYRTALTIEDAARTVGGDKLENVRKFFGL